MSAGDGGVFYKMCGSGNDFVFLDGRRSIPAELRTPAAIRALCERRTGVGADGVVYLDPPAAGSTDAFRMRYHNSDGSLASFCGNATLCATRLGVELGIAPVADDFSFGSDAGTIVARLRSDLPEVELAPVQGLVEDAIHLEREAGEHQIGFAVAGVPHVVVRVDDVERVELEVRGRALRHASALGREGANVNFVAPAGDGAWLMRTYERGVEGETLACGSGAVSCASVLRSWGLAGDEATIVTRSGRPLIVRQPPQPGRGPTLRGEGRIVFVGRLRELGIG